MKLRKAKKSEVSIIKDMYRSVIGVNNSVWDEKYPNEVNAESDYNSGNLYVLENAGEIIGACSVESESEFKDLSCWKINDGSQKEISRIVISRDNQGKGFAKIMVKALIETLAESGCRAVHLLVAKSNLAAVKTYRRLEFEFKGECSAFGHDYYAAEYIINKEEI